LGPIESIALDDEAFAIQAMDRWGMWNVVKPPFVRDASGFDLLAGDGHSGFLSFTPGSPPLVKTTPVTSRARRMASTVLYRGNIFRFSNAIIVERDTRETFARASWLIPNSLRAALLSSAEMVICP
jgi:hypothetical protein